MLATVGCGRSPLSNAQPSAEALARHVLSALAISNRERLVALALTSEEFSQRVWRDLPVARPERNVPREYVWGDLEQKSAQMLKRTIARYGGAVYELQSVYFAGTTTDHGAYRIHRDAVLTARDASGQTRELHVMGSMIEADGGWKVYSYVVDD